MRPVYQGCSGISAGADMKSTELQTNSESVSEITSSN